MPAPDLALGRSVSRETTDRLAAYADLLRRWNRAINLVSPATLGDIERRHFADGVQLLDLAPPEGRRWADLGSGGGFPGMVVAIVAADERPALQMTLVESDRRKCAFLETVARELSVPATVIARRIEDTPPLAADVVSARALAPLTTLLDYAERHLRPGGTALFPKGEGYAGEIATALARWRFVVQKHPSRSNPLSAILEIRELARV